MLHDYIGINDIEILYTTHVKLNANSLILIRKMMQVNTFLECEGGYYFTIIQFKKGRGVSNTT